MRLKHVITVSILSASVLFSGTSSALAIYEFSSFLNSSSLGATSLQDTQLGTGYVAGEVGANELGSAGLSTSFTNNLGTDNAGTVSWNITNTTGSDLQNVSFFGFLDAEIVEGLNTFFNEFGSISSFVAGSGSGDALADSWEIDEPGLTLVGPPGDIFGNLLDGVLDNTNGVPDTSVNDVSMALGFDIGTLLAGQSLIATFDISFADNGGLLHYDPMAQTGFYFNGTAYTVTPNVSVPEPASLMLMGVGLLMMVAGTTRKSRFKA